MSSKLIKGLSFTVPGGGFIRVVDVMGDDSSIVEAARVSYAKGTKTVSDDRSLIRYLMRHDHTSPFEMCEIKLHVRVPMDTWRQWIRHRTASVNEISTRYSIVDVDDESCFLSTQPGEWRQQSKNNKQGSAGYLPEDMGMELSVKERLLHQQAIQVYKERIDMGVAREQARKDLPLSTFTEAFWKIDLKNLLHFLRLRMHPTAQKEIRDYAEIIGNRIVAKWVPLTWEAFENYKLKSITLSNEDIMIISILNQMDAAHAVGLMVRYGYINPESRKLTGSGKEFVEKASRLINLDKRIIDALTAEDVDERQLHLPLDELKSSAS
jgi:thymidylate synthase (FAD)